MDTAILSQIHQS
jgi:hypothetical protein